MRGVKLLMFKWASVGENTELTRETYRDASAALKKGESGHWPCKMSLFGRNSCLYMNVWRWFIFSTGGENSLSSGWEKERERKSIDVEVTAREREEASTTYIRWAEQSIRSFNQYACHSSTCMKSRKYSFAQTERAESTACIRWAEQWIRSYNQHPCHSSTCVKSRKYSFAHMKREEKMKLSVSEQHVPTWFRFRMSIHQRGLWLTVALS